MSSHQLLPNYPYVIEDEWEVEADRTDKGRGDLVFTDGIGCFGVVEVTKIIQTTYSTTDGSSTQKAA